MAEVTDKLNVINYSSIKYKFIRLLVKESGAISSLLLSMFLRIMKRQEVLTEVESSLQLTSALVKLVL